MLNCTFSITEILLDDNLSETRDYYYQPEHMLEIKKFFDNEIHKEFFKDTLKDVIESIKFVLKQDYYNGEVTCTIEAKTKPEIKITAKQQKEFIDQVLRYRRFFNCSEIPDVDTHYRIVMI